MSADTLVGLRPIQMEKQVLRRLEVATLNHQLSGQWMEVSGRYGKFADVASALQRSPGERFLDNINGEYSRILRDIIKDRLRNASLLGDYNTVIQGSDLAADFPSLGFSNFAPY